MVQKKYLFSIITISSLLVFTSCPPKRETLYMTDEFKSYVMFPTGSYWIYEDSLSGIIDSNYLQGQRISIIESDDYNINFEYLVQYYSNDGDFNISGGNVVGIDNTNNKLILFYRLSITGEFCSDIMINETIWGLSYVGYYEEFILNENIYKSVKVFICGRIILYWAKDIGLIRFEKYSTINDPDPLEIWNLIRYHIN